MARWIELAAARSAAMAPAPRPEFRALDDYEPYAMVADRLERTMREELAGLQLGTSRRIAFYPLGAATAARLEAADSGWQRRYPAEPFRIGLRLEASLR